jgi:hypothetical protein
MDYKTAIESYIELEKEGPYKGEAVDLLSEEVIQSDVICEKDKLILERLLENIRYNKRYGDSEPFEEIWNILSKYNGFRAQWAKLGTEILLGKRKI